MWLYLDPDSYTDELKQTFYNRKYNVCSVYKLIFRSFSGIGNYTIGLAGRSSHTPDYYDFYIYERYWNSAEYCDISLIMYTEDGSTYINDYSFIRNTDINDTHLDYHEMTIDFDKLGEFVNYKPITEAYIAFYDIG